MSVFVGKKVFDFNVVVVLGNGEIVESFILFEVIKGKYGLVFFYLLDFIFVCLFELIVLDYCILEFQVCNVEVIGVFIDFYFIYNVWCNILVDKGGIGVVKYILVVDIKYEIVKVYDVEFDGGVVFCGVFLIDKEGVVCLQIVNDLLLGCNMDELLCLVDVLQFYEEYGEVCLVNWKKGDKGMIVLFEGVVKYLVENVSKL